MSEVKPYSDEELAELRAKSVYAPIAPWQLARLHATIDARDARLAEVERERDVLRTERNVARDCLEGEAARADHFEDEMREMRAGIAAAEARAERLEKAVNAALPRLRDLVGNVYAISSAFKDDPTPDREMRVTRLSARLNDVVKDLAAPPEPVKG